MNTHQSVSATEFYDELESALAQLPNCDAAYRMLRNTFLRLLDENTQNTSIVFRGPYPKTDYLLKERMATGRMRQRVHSTRVRLRQIRTLADSDKARYVLNDLASMCEFVSLIYSAPIPQRLASATRDAVVPEPAAPDYKPFADKVRMIVSTWTDDYFGGKIDGLETDEDIRVPFKSEKHDLTHVQQLLSPGCEVNLVRPRWTDDHQSIDPEFVIYEPDYLVDISSVASCFEQYARSPYVRLIKRLLPKKVSSATTLGNMAGEVLDKILHDSDNVDLRDISRRFMESNAIAMATLTEPEKRDMWDNLKKQAVNIRAALTEALPQSLGDRYDRDISMVEPSFFVEMLGLQGRMDFYQTDGMLILEQKSGKGAYPFDNFETPRATEQHMVQLALYVCIVRYAFPDLYRKNKGNLHAFLLYSKYTKSLYDYGVGVTQLIEKAIEIRNQIAWCEMQYAHNDGYRWLDLLTAERMMKNPKVIGTKLWEQYQKPEIEKTLGTIRQASPLERAYFYEMMRFVANEHMLSKVGGKAKESAGFASKWNETLDDKLEAGNIFANLRLTDPTDKTQPPIETLTFAFADNDDNRMTNFRVGDIVMAYPYREGTEPDVRKTMVFRGRIKDITADAVTLKLGASQSSTNVFLKDQNSPWAVEHDFLESAVGESYRGIYSFLAAPQSRRDLLLCQRMPEVDESITQLKSDVAEQFRTLALNAKRAKDLFLIIGPPGTGKTSHGLMTLVREELAEEGRSVLLMSYTNRAVDEICEKLIEAGIDFVRIGHELSASAESQPYLLTNRVQQMGSSDQIKAGIEGMRVVVGTTMGLTTQASLFQLKTFDLAIIDEASQILEPHILPILCATNGNQLAIKRFVMIGDHKQLPAVVQQSEEMSAVSDESLRAIHLTNCRLSLFERMLRQYGDDERVVYMLTRQGRMHPEIAQFPNYAFYANRLEAVPIEHQRQVLPTDVESRDGLERIIATRRIAFIATAATSGQTSDKVNQDEADVIAAIALRIYNRAKAEGRFDPTKTLGIIVPYRNQIATVRNTIQSIAPQELADITIDTVERYQGSQRRYIIYGFTIKKDYQLGFLTSNVFEDVDGQTIDRKLNVAMTRAQEGLIMVGNPCLLSADITFFKLLEFVRSKHGYFEAEKDDIVAGRFEVPIYSTQEVDLSQALFQLSESFHEAFDALVYEPIKEASGASWPMLVMGKTMFENEEAIGYGRANFVEATTMYGRTLTPSAQVLLYCYYTMRRHYCSIRNVYSSYAEYLKREVRATGGRVVMVDMGCGPATCLFAFREAIGEAMTRMNYLGIDISEAMMHMGRCFADEVGEGLTCRFETSIENIDDDYWQSGFELPTTVVFNLSYFLACIDSIEAERIATEMTRIMKRFALNKYIFVVQQGQHDVRNASYRVFVKKMSEHAQTIADAEASVAYQLNHAQRHLNFRYTLMQGY